MPESVEHVADKKQEKPAKRPSEFPEAPGEAAAETARAAVIAAPPGDGVPVREALARAGDETRAEVMQELQSDYGNTFVQRFVAPPVRAPAAPAVQRQLAVQRSPGPPGGAGGGKTKAPDAASLVAAQYPSLKLPGDQMATLQKVFDYRAKMDELNERRKPYANSILSDEVAKREAIDKEAQPYLDFLFKNPALWIPTELVLTDDILIKDEEAKKRKTKGEISFREQFYKTLISAVTKLTIGEGMDPKPLFTFGWGGYNWVVPNTGGKVTFTNWMTIQKFNVAYQSAVLKDEIVLLEEMYEIARKAGAPYNMTGKKVGETWGYVWNTSIKVGPELGAIGGYANDARGRVEMDMDTMKAAGAKIILMAPDNFMHVFALDPDLKSHHMRNPNKTISGAAEDGYVYLYAKGSQVGNVISIGTGDGVALEPGGNDYGSGWRCKEVLTEYEQFSIGAILGDAWDDPSAVASFGQIVIGVIPIVGQIADARDVAVGIHKIWTSGGKDGKLQTALALIGFIPLLGDGIKAARKAIKGEAKAAAKQAVKEAVGKSAGAAEEVLAKRLLHDADAVAKVFKVSKGEVEAMTKNLAELAQKVAKGEAGAAEEYAKTMAKHLDAAGGDASVLVHIGGGKWKNIANLLKESDTGKVLGGRMETWRRTVFQEAELNKMAKSAGEFGPDVGKGMTEPAAKVTGTPAFTSDVDVSFMGPNATTHRNTAIRQMEDRFGKNWRDVFDADIFADPTRLHMFTQLDSKFAKQAEKRLVKESELNVFAKMLNDGKSLEEVKKMATEMKAEVDWGAVVKRQEELKDLAKNKELYQQLELKMDVLHSNFLKETDPAARAKIAEEMATIQGKLNAAVEGPYMTPGGAAKHVTRREGLEGVRKGAYEALSPAMGYMLFLDDLYMLQHTMSKEMGPGTAKSMVKYADRIMVTAGQYGVDMSKAGGARSLFDQCATLLEASRENPAEAFKRAAPLFENAKSMLSTSLTEMGAAVRKNATDALDPMIEKSLKIINQELAILGRITLRQNEKPEEENK